jgi:hypothetical protein
MKRSLALTAGAALAGTVVFVLAPRGEAVNTRTFTLDSSAELSAGVLDRTAVTSDGTVTLGLEVQRIAPDPAASSVWSLLDMGDGSALAGTGVDGRVYRVEGGRSTLYAETGAVVVTSLTRGEDGAVYAGTLPEGKIFRLRPPQGGRIQAPELFVQLPDTEHVWAVAWDRARHVLLAATGPQGKLFAVDRGGNASVVFDSDEPHLYSLALGADGTAYVGGGGGRAVLYAVRGPGNVRAVARFPGDEVKSIVVAGDELYAAANEFPEPPEPPRRTQALTRVPTPGGPSTTTRPRPGRGAVYLVRANGTTARLYNNAESHVTALELDREHGGELLAALGVGGRIVGIAPDRTSRLLVDVDESQVLSLAMTGRARLFGTGDTGVFYAVSNARPTSASWTSRVLDSTSVARWGVVRWRGTGALDWEARSGNTDPPDNTWSPWTALAANGGVQSPATRYLQIRARWTRDPNTVMRAVTVYYLPTNQPPVLTEVSAEAKTGDPRPQAVKIAWKVDNPDGDSIRYRLRFRGEGEQNWRPVLRQGEFVTATTYDWSVEGLPEGFYRLQVEASDEASNPPGEAERDLRQSEPVLVDNTPPRVTATVAGGRVRGEAVDAASAVMRIEMAVDTQDWRPLRALDGVLDERSEQYEAALPVFTDGGEHVVAIRAYDEAGNVGTASATFRSAAAPAAPAPARARGR